MNNLPERSGLSRYQNPIKSIAKLQKKMDHMFDDFLFPDFSGDVSSLKEFDFFPQCDIESTDTHYVLSFDLPGIKKEDIHLEVRQNILTISGERKEEKEIKRRNQYQSECFYGSFERSFTLPESLREDQVETHFSNGVLKVAIPRLTSEKVSKIKINEEKGHFWDKLLSHKKEEDKK